MYVIVWQFAVRPEKVDAFIAAYRSDGAWAKLFAKTNGYVGTELLRSTDSGGEQKFVTLDRWQSAEDFARFQEHFGSEYRLLDAQLEDLTSCERKMGTFTGQD